jgi:hypothetical protein
MNYLTNYYKNLSEQLQEKVNFLERQLDEAYVLSPYQKLAGSKTSYDAGVRQTRMDQGRKRANILGQMMAAHTYDAVNDHERAAIANIIADTHSSVPQRSNWAHAGFHAFAPSEGRAGTQASGQDLRVALGAIKRLGKDAKFAQHVTDTVAAELPGTMVDRGYMEDMMADKDYPQFGARDANRLGNVSRSLAANLPASTSPSAATTEFGARMNAIYPGDERDYGPNEYSHYVPMDVVTRMSKRMKGK